MVTGFSAYGRVISATLSSGVRLLPGACRATGYLTPFPISITESRSIRRDASLSVRGAMEVKARWAIAPIDAGTAKMMQSTGRDGTPTPVYSARKRINRGSVGDMQHRQMGKASQCSVGTEKTAAAGTGGRDVAVVNSNAPKNGARCICARRHAVILASSSANNRMTGIWQFISRGRPGLEQKATAQLLRSRAPSGLETARRTGDGRRG